MCYVVTPLTHARGFQGFYPGTSRLIGARRIIAAAIGPRMLLSDKAAPNLRA
jgi:hypothetical protein